MVAARSGHGGHNSIGGEQGVPFAEWIGASWLGRSVGLTARLEPDPSTRLPNRLEDSRQVGPRSSLVACCPDNLAQHHHGPPTYPWRGYRTLYSAIPIGIKPPRLFPLHLIPCLPDIATSLRWIRAETTTGFQDPPAVGTDFPVTRR